MQQAAKELDEARRQRTAYNKSHTKEDIKNVSNGGNYLRTVKQEAFMDSDMNLAERLNSKSHYRSRLID